VANAAKDTPTGGGRTQREAYDQTVGDLVGNLLGRKRRNGSGSRARGETYRFVAYLDRIPPHILEDDAFKQRHSAAQEVECEIEAEDFAAAVAEAIRTLEEDEFTHVQAIERLSL
jgi:hypothetical protein